MDGNGSASTAMFGLPGMLLWAVSSLTVSLSRRSRRPPGRLAARAAEWLPGRMAAGRSGFTVCRARAGR